jgi:fermentation-respiration switch protein FrsA (DUF1100 family)
VTGDDDEDEIGRGHTDYPVRKVKSMVWTALGAAAIGYIAMAALMVVFQSRLLFFPDRHIVMTPADVGLPYESVKFDAEDGVTLAGWFVPGRSESRGVALFCHGNAGNISHRLEAIQTFHRLGLDTFIFDYRGFGESGGKVSEQGTYMDAAGAWQYLVRTRHVAPEDIVIVGRSLGGAIAAWLAQDRTPRALIVEATFSSVPDVGAKAYPIFPVRLLSRFRYATAEYVRNVTSPILVVHSRADEMIPIELGRKVFDAANEPKQFLELQGSHNEGFFRSASVYEKGIAEFLALDDRP